LTHEAEESKHNRFYGMKASFPPRSWWRCGQRVAGDLVSRSARIQTQILEEKPQAVLTITDAAAVNLDVTGVDASQFDD